MTDTADADAPVEACDMNLGPRQRRRRLRGGLLNTATTIAVAIALVATDSPRWWRLVVHGLLVAALLGYLQYRAKT